MENEMSCFALVSHFALGYSNDYRKVEPVALWSSLVHFSLVLCFL